MSNRTMADLRESLFDAIDELRSGDMEESTAKEICQVADRILTSAELEIKYRGILSAEDRCSVFIEDLRDPDDEYAEEEADDDFEEIDDEVEAEEVVTPLGRVSKRK